jgi:hypothetical protein
VTHLHTIHWPRNKFLQKSFSDKWEQEKNATIYNQTSCNSKSMTVVKTQFWKRCPLKFSGQEKPNLRDPLWRASFRHKTNHQLAYLLTAWNRVLLEKVIGCQLVKKFPTFYGTRRFITAFTGANYQQTQIMANFQYIKINSKFYVIFFGYLTTHSLSVSKDRPHTCTHLTY